MKKSTIIFLLLIGLFDLLFYKQIPGVNVSIFCLILLSASIILNPGLRRDKKWILIAATTFTTSLFVGIYGDPLSVLACLISFALLAAYTAQKESSIFVALASSIFAFFKSPYLLIKNSANRISNLSIKENSPWKLLIIGITALIVSVFFLIYRNSSLLFYDLTQKIDLSFISFPFIAFTFLAALMLTAFKEYIPVPFLQQLLDKPAKKLNSLPSITDAETRKNMIELFAGILMLSSLNALLLLVNILDLRFLLIGGLPNGITYSNYIHQGVGSLIVSIVLAISIILYFFRGELNFSKNKWLKTLAYIWMAQNLLIVISSFMRNSLYIDAYGLTEKRIGVYFYLLLTALGLATTLLKIKRQQSNPYLIRSTSFAFFVVLIVSCTINWDNIITRHNLARSDADKNFEYLNTLSHTNIPQLIEYQEKKKSLNRTEDIKNLEYLHKNILNRINYYEAYGDWQSFIYTRRNTYEKIQSYQPESIYLNNVRPPELKGIERLSYIKSLSIRNTDLNKVNIWPNIRQLRALTLNNCSIPDLSFVYYLNHLEFLDISKNYTPSFTPLYGLKSLKELHISSVHRNDLEILRIMLPNTKIFVHKL